MDNLHIYTCKCDNCLISKIMIGYYRENQTFYIHNEDGKLVLGTQKQFEEHIKKYPCLNKKI